MSDVNDWIQDALAAEARAQGLTAYEMAKRLDGSPTKEAIHRYLFKAENRCHLGSQHVSRIATLLGMKLVASKKKAGAK